MTTTERHNLNTAPDAIARRVDFDCNGTLHGHTRNFYDGGAMRLPNEYMRAFNLDRTADDFYAVYSYATPIAWFARGKWTVPPVKYSPTTSRHQSAVRKALV